MESIVLVDFPHCIDVHSSFKGPLKPFVVHADAYHELTEYKIVVMVTVSPFIT